MSSENIPECLSNRNKALDGLVRDVLAYVENTSNSSYCCSGKSKHPKRDESICEEPAKKPSKEPVKEPIKGPVKEPVNAPVKEPVNAPVKEPVKDLSVEKKSVCPLACTDGAFCKNDAIGTLLCDFWRIMKDEPQFKLPKMQSKVCVEACSRSSCGSKGKKQKCSTGLNSTSAEDTFKSFNVPITREPKKHDPKPSVPLRKALSNLKEAACFEKICAERVNELLSAQQSLTEQVQNLEEKEKQGVVLLKKADCMWSSMEDEYKKQLDEKKEMYKMLLKEKSEIETVSNKWRKNMRDFEFKIKNVDNASQEISVKTIQKANDIKVFNMEIEGFKKRIASNAKDLEAAKNSYTSKKKASDARLEKITEEMQRFQKKVGDERQCKEDKEQEGTGFVKEARDDLQKICRSLLQKKLENEDLRAEKEALLQEIELLKITSDTCSERCAEREKNIVEETKRIDNEISNYQKKCIQCHRSTDNAELTGYCIDCPRCVIKRDCLIKGEECFTDHTKDCVCQRVKDKFLDNVFENMYSVLEKKTKTCPGKEVADCIFTCLERSRNGKLDEETKKILQEFILSTVKQNLNLTIVGGAVKTRCEMDAEMYGQLMLCLKDVAVTKPVKTDKGTVPRKPPCSRWEETSECNCPKGPKNCPCVRKAPKPPTEPGSCGQPEDEEIESSITPDAGLFKRQPCEKSTCLYVTNMRAAQCMLGSEALSKVRAHPKHPTPPVVPSGTFTNKKATRISGNNALKSCHTDDRSHEQSRHEMIEGVMGRYTEVSPIEEEATRFGGNNAVKSRQTDDRSHEQSRHEMLEGAMGRYTEVSPIEEVHVADHHCEMCAATGTYSGCGCARLPTQNKKKGYTKP